MQLIMSQNNQKHCPEDLPALEILWLQFLSDCFEALALETPSKNAN